MLLPLAIVPAMVVAASMFPGGLVFSSDSFMPKFSRLNPLNFFKTIFSGKKMADTLASVAKSAALVAAMWFVVRASTGKYLGLLDLPLNEALAQGARLMLSGTLVLCIVLLVFAFIDVPVQVLLFLRGQRMSKQEVKEEHKTSEGRPEVRQRIRQLQNQIGRRSVRKTVPGADVVIVNPEHYAVALKYDEKRAEAPYVVAKGVDEMALYIREVAAAYAVEVVPMPPLARAIYNTSQVNQQIPATLYQAVARVLSYVLQIKAFRGGRRPGAPLLPDVAVPAHLSEY
jgi:flagellar biosynthesis protein FlhB